MPFTMVHIEVRTRNLVEWARSNSLALSDRDYLVHNAMRLAFGEKAPQPFEVFQNGDNSLKVLGYCDHTRDNLLKEMEFLAEPLLTETFPKEAIRFKNMPESWEVGRTFGFRLRCCPISRKRDEKGRIIERDSFLSACEHDPEGEHERESVYLKWLQEHICRAEGAELLETKVKGFRLSEFKRRDERRKPKKIIRPEVIFEGILKVIDSSAFASMLRNGIGRHKAFGFGTIFLRAAVR